MLTPTQTVVQSPQDGRLTTDGPFRLICTTEEKAAFQLVDDPNWGVLELTLTGLQARCGWTREHLQKARGNTVYFLHTITGNNESYEALTCWSPGKYTFLNLTPLLQSIVDREEEEGRVN